MKNQSVYLWVLSVALLSIATVYYLSPILTPFMIGALLAYLANPLVVALERHHVSHMVSVLVVFFLMLVAMVAVALTIVPFVDKQVSVLIEKIPAIVTWVQETVSHWVAMDQAAGGERIASVKGFLEENLGKAGGYAGNVLKYALHSWMSLFEWLMNLLLIPVVTFYLMRDRTMMLTNAQRLLPSTLAPTIVRIVSECDEVLSAFLRGQLLVMIVLGLFYAFALTAVGVPMGMLIGLIAGLLNIVPFLGFVLGIVVASIAAYVQYHSFNAVLPVLLVFLLGQTLDHLFLTPHLVGNRIGLHPVAVIFSVLAGGCLFGLVGTLLALPVAAVLMVLGRHYLSHMQRAVAS